MSSDVQKKKNVLIIFGGKSGEHQVSIHSAQSIEEKIDRDKFQTRCVGITQDGKWHYGANISEITDGKRVLPPKQEVFLPNEDQQNSLSVKTETGIEKLQFDLIFPIVHGTNGEDGTLQGLLELSNLPYVGANVLGSAISMDKVIQKQLCSQANIPQTKYVWFKLKDWELNRQNCLDQIEPLTLPLFIKPANLGSSVGISKVATKEELIPAIELALSYDHKILIEQAVENIYEIEVAVLGNDEPEASVCAAVIPKTEFYDYETKYITSDFQLDLPAKIPDDISNKIRETAITVFKLLNCSGLARVDFFYQKESNQYFLNELNTLPGFTSTSMYPKLWAASGLEYTELITKLLTLAEERWREKQSLQYTYE